MRILLQHVGTQLFFRELGQWTPHHFEAVDFRQVPRALDFARDHNITGVQIAVKFADSQFDEIVPLPAFHHALPPPAPSVPRVQS